MSDREDAIRNAIRFLTDPKVKEAPLAKKIAFLEGKGLSSSEIQSALSQVEGGGVGTSTTAPMQPLQIIQQQPQSNWKQAVITSAGVLSAGAALMYAAKLYLGPYFDLPSAKSVLEDTESIEKQLKGAGNALDQVTLSTQDVMKGLEAHAQNVSSSLAEMSNLLNNLRESDDKRTVELKLIKNEVEELKATFPKLVEKTQENQANMLDQIQAEMKSLKSLLLNRRVPNDTTTPSSSAAPVSGFSAPSATSSFAGVNFGKTTIPSWQMAAKKETIVPPATTSTDANANARAAAASSSSVVAESNAESPETPSIDSDTAAIHIRSANNSRSSSPAKGNKGKGRDRSVSPKRK